MKKKWNCDPEEFLLQPIFLSTIWRSCWEICCEMKIEDIVAVAYWSMLNSSHTHTKKQFDLYAMQIKKAVKNLLKEMIDSSFFVGTFMSSITYWWCLQKIKHFTLRSQWLLDDWIKCLDIQYSYIMGIYEVPLKFLMSNILYQSIYSAIRLLEDYTTFTVIVKIFIKSNKESNLIPNIFLYLSNNIFMGIVQWHLE